MVDEAVSFCLPLVVSHVIFVFLLSCILCVCVCVCVCAFVLYVTDLWQSKNNYKCKQCADQNAVAEGPSRVLRPLRKNSTPVMPMYGMSENKASFWKLLLSSEKAVTQSPVIFSN